MIAVQDDGKVLLVIELVDRPDQFSCGPLQSLAVSSSHAGGYIKNKNKTVAVSFCTEKLDALVCLFGLNRVSRGTCGGV